MNSEKSIEVLAAKPVEKRTRKSALSKIVDEFREQKTVIPVQRNSDPEEIVFDREQAKKWEREKKCPKCGNDKVPKDSIGPPKLITCKICGWKFFQLRG